MKWKYLNLCSTAKAMLGGKLITLPAFIRKGDTLKKLLI